jgi:hypothetical protein
MDPLRGSPCCRCHSWYAFCVLPDSFGSIRGPRAPVLSWSTDVGPVVALAGRLDAGFGLPLDFDLIISHGPPYNSRRLSTRERLITGSVPAPRACACASGRPANCWQVIGPFTFWRLQHPRPGDSYVGEVERGRWLTVGLRWVCVLFAFCPSGIAFGRGQHSKASPTPRSLRRAPSPRHLNRVRGGGVMIS